MCSVGAGQGASLLGWVGVGQGAGTQRLRPQRVPQSCRVGMGYALLTWASSLPALWVSFGVSCGDSQGCRGAGRE